MASINKAQPAEDSDVAFPSASTSQLSTQRQPTTTAMLVESDPSDYEDAGEPGHGSKEARIRTVDLFDIGKEGEMAPLVLPRDEKKWKEEEELRRENERAMNKLRRRNSKEKQRQGEDMKQAADPGRETTAEIKTDPYEEEGMLHASLGGTPAASAAADNSAFSKPTLAKSQTAQIRQTEALGSEPVVEGLTATQEAATLGAEDVKIKVKREDISTYFKFPSDAVHQEHFYVLQFPRLFPQFYDPSDPNQSAETLANDMQPGTSQVKAERGAVKDSKPSLSALGKALGAGGAPGIPAPLTNPYDASAKHKIKSSLHESESDAWRDYEPGKWQGWGRNAGREDREAMAGNKAAQGKVGKIKIRRSGKTTLKLGNIEYEVCLL